MAGRLHDRRAEGAQADVHGLADRAPQADLALTPRTTRTSQPRRDNKAARRATTTSASPRATAPPYEEWSDTHDNETGEETGGGGGGGWRDKSANWHESHLSITENPADSNCDSRSDGIRTSQDGCAGGTWLRYQPWCGCWAWSGLYAAGKVKQGRLVAGQRRLDRGLRQAGQGSLQGLDDRRIEGEEGRPRRAVRPRPARRDRALDRLELRLHLGGQHAAVPRAARRSNGGGSYKRQRSRSGETYGYALVKD